MVTITAPKSKYVDNNDVNTYTLKWTNAYSGQYGFAVLYKLKSSASWLTTGIINSTATSYDLRNINNLLGIDIDEIQYRLVVYYKTSDGTETRDFSDAAYIYSLIFNSGISGHLKVNNGSTTIDHPTFTTIKNNNIEKLNIQTASGKQMIPLVDSSSPLAGKTKIKTSSGVKNLATNNANFTYDTTKLTTYGTAVSYTVNTVYAKGSYNSERTSRYDALRYDGRYYNSAYTSYNTSYYGNRGYTTYYNNYGYTTTNTGAYASSNATGYGYYNKVTGTTYENVLEYASYSYISRYYTYTYLAHNEGVTYNWSKVYYYGTWYSDAFRNGYAYWYAYQYNSSYTVYTSYYFNYYNYTTAYIPIYAIGKGPAYYYYTYSNRTYTELLYSNIFLYAYGGGGYGSDGRAYSWSSAEYYTKKYYRNGYYKQYARARNYGYYGYYYYASRIASGYTAASYKYVSGRYYSPAYYYYYLVYDTGSNLRYYRAQTNSYTSTQYSYNYTRYYYYYYNRYTSYKYTTYGTYYYRTDAIYYYKYYTATSYNYYTVYYNKYYTTYYYYYISGYDNRSYNYRYTVS